MALPGTVPVTLESDAEQATAQAENVLSETGLPAEAPSPDTPFADAPALRAARPAKTETVSAEKTQSAKPETESRPEREATNILSVYPEVPVVHMTSDGLGFFKDFEARNHADMLRDKTATTVKRK